MPGSDLLPHQERVRRRVVEGGQPRLLVYHGLGSGKTRTAIEAAQAAGGSHLAVVPASLRPNYRSELNRWAVDPGLAEILSHTAVGRGAVPQAPSKTLVVDEAHRLRNPATAAARRTAALAADAERLLLLTGSPIVNAPGDLAVPLGLITGKRLDPAAFEDRYVGTERVRPGWLGRLRGVTSGERKTLVRERELERLLRGKVDYHPKRAPEGVTVREERVPVELSKPQRQFLDLMFQKLPWHVRWKLRNDFPLSKTELRNLQAFLTGPREVGLSLRPFQPELSPEEAFDGSPKLLEAMRRLEGTLADPRAKGLIFSNFVRAGVEPYAAALERRGIPARTFHGGLSDSQRAQAVADYNAGKARVLLMGPSGGEGISTKGTSLIQILDPHFHQTRSDQAAGRGLRFDSHAGLPDDLKDVRVERYVARNPEPSWWARRLAGRRRDPTADEILERMSARKDELNQQFLDVLRRVGSEAPDGRRKSRS